MAAYDFIADHETLRVLTRIVLAASYAVLHTTAAQKALLLVLLTGLLLSSFYAIRCRRKKMRSG